MLSNLAINIIMLGPPLNSVLNETKNYVRSQQIMEGQKNKIN